MSNQTKFQKEDVGSLVKYADSCIRISEMTEDPEHIGKLKAEALNVLEAAVEADPEHAPAWYSLGYRYANMGLYIKATLAWRRYLALEEDGSPKISDGAKEIRERLTQLKEPAEIEQACSHILAGRIEEGMGVLERKRTGKYADYWPLWYYLGEGYLMRGAWEQAEECYKKVLTFAGSETNSMQRLVQIYEAEGEEEKASKYRNKIALINSNKFVSGEDAPGM
jgi:tetratricopeptide (TPR) repeat protein